ncbi:hypothetical protein HY490_00945 [Candidatus Woesearchaeota archaeon]|nr:hypothetical protein [Candidatus Woesearchaeota archaeon]
MSYALSMLGRKGELDEQIIRLCTPDWHFVTERSPEMALLYSYVCENACPPRKYEILIPVFRLAARRLRGVSKGPPQIWHANPVLPTDQSKCLRDIVMTCYDGLMNASKLGRKIIYG